MESKEFKEITASTDLQNLFLDMIYAISGDPIAAGKISVTMLQFPFMLRENLFWNKVKKFIDGVYQSPDGRRKLSVQLADNLENTEYGKRMFKILDEIDTEVKTEYIINLARVLAQGKIDSPLYFRLCNVLVKSLDEDLKFIKENIGYTEFNEDITTNELENNGLMYESQKGYAFTELAFRLNEYALSYNDEDKVKFISSKLSGKRKYIFADINNCIGGGEF